MDHSRRKLLKLAAGAVAATSLPAAEDGFEPIFNGKDLTGWEGDPFIWKVEDGDLVGKHPGIPYNDFLASEKSYSDFILRFQIHLVNHSGNSGMQIRSQRIKGSMEMIGYQADVGQTYWGSLYDESRRRVVLQQADEKVVERALKVDDWNDYEVHAEGKRIVLKLNGITTVDYTEEDDSIPLEGRLATQVHSGPPIESRFRDIRIKTI